MGGCDYNDAVGLASRKRHACLPGAVGVGECSAGKRVSVDKEQFVEACVYEEKKAGRENDNGVGGRTA